MGSSDGRPCAAPQDLLLLLRPITLPMYTGPEGLLMRRPIPPLRSIGRVENGLPLGTPGEDLRAATSRIVLEPDLQPGLEGLEDETRILVVFYFHQSKDWELLQHPRGDRSRPKRGVFSLRSPRRPNPIGITEVEILEIRGNVLAVRGLDAVDGTPVLDLKPA